MDGVYTVYIHINKYNGKKYIGMTGLKPTERWGKNGHGYKTSKHFWAAIQKYGWDNFEHVIYQTELTKGQAAGLEQQLILLYETQNPDKGYNFSGGGESGGYIDGRSSDKEWLRLQDWLYRHTDKERIRQRALEYEHRPEVRARRKQRRKEKYWENPEAERAKGLESYYKYHDKALERAAKYKAEHLEELRIKSNEHAKQYYQDHKQERIEYARKHRQENREKINARRRELAALKREKKKQQEQNV